MYRIELTDKAQKAYDESDYRIASDSDGYYIVNWAGRKVEAYLTEEAVNEWFEDLADEREVIG